MKKIQITANFRVNLLLVLFFLLLEIAYKEVEEVYGYLGFEYSFSVGRYALSKIFFLASLIFNTWFRKNDYTYTVVNIISIFFLIPNLVIYEFMDANIIIVSSILLLQILIVLFENRINLIQIPRFKSSEAFYLLTALATLFLVPVVLDFGFELNFKNLLFEEIYDVRLEARDKTSLITGYVMPWLSNVILPVLLIYSLNQRRYLITLFVIVILLYLFLVIAAKSIFLSIFVFVFGYVMKEHLRQLQFMLLGVTLTILISVLPIEEIMPVKAAIQHLVVRRIFLIPAMLNVLYLDFFAEVKMHLSHSVLGPFFQNPLGIDPQYAIGMHYFKVDTNAGNGIISSGYMNFGYLGILANITIVAIIINYIGKLKIHPTYFGIIINYIIILNGGNLIPALITHGLLLFMIIAPMTIKDTSIQNSTS